MSQAIPARETGIVINDINTTNRAWLSYSVARWNAIVVQVFSVGASWPAGVTVDIEVSHDGITWSAFSTAQTYSANGTQAKIDVGSLNLVRARVSTSSSSGTIRVVVMGDRNG